MQRCDTCEDYFGRRNMVIARATVEIARSRRIAARVLAVAYIRAVHKRHLAGLSLDTG